jgi:hypothetical protein
MLYFLDTSAILNEAQKQYQNVWISPLILTELESIKNNSNKDDQIKYLAREAIRDIISNNKYNFFIPEQRKVDKKIKVWKISFLIHRIIHIVFN